MTENVWTETYKVSSFLVNLQNRLGLFAALNLVQDAGWEHAVKMGIGYEEMAAKGIGWVLTRQRLAMNAWPAWGEQVEVRTWLRPASGAFLFRDFELFVAGHRVGEATSSFVTIDLGTRKLVKQDWSAYNGHWREEGALPLDPPKLLPAQEAEILARFHVRNGDLDANEHVNNTRYAQWILDSLPVDRLRSAFLHEYEVNFLAETKSGDEIALQRATAGGEWSQFQGLREADAKIVFVARLRAS